MRPHTPLSLTRQGIFMYLNLFYTAVLGARIKSNPSHKSLDKTLKKIIRVMQKIGLTTSTDRNTSTPENFGATIEQHDLPTIWSWVSNGWFSSIFRTQKFLLSGHTHVYRRDIYIKGQLMRLTWYHQNPRFWKCLL